MTVNENFETSVSMAGFAFEPVYPLEITNDRLTALLKLSAMTTLQIPDELFKSAQTAQCSEDKTTDQSPMGQSIGQSMGEWQGIEILILEGTCSIGGGVYSKGNYIRIPEFANNTITAVVDCILFIKVNQFLHGDNGARTIQTRAHREWLPGPVDGIEIRPLHVFNTESIMLLRWHHAAEFKPKLNPRGEEILVVNGLLQNRDHLYRQYSWIRNPIEDWRRWHGNTGTIAYYKSGHFPDDPLRHKQP